MQKAEYRSPEELKLLTDKNRQETGLFIKRLKKKKPRNLDDIVHGLHMEAFNCFSCLNCANCCKTIGPRLTGRKNSGYLNSIFLNFFKKTCIIKIPLNQNWLYPVINLPAQFPK